MDYEEIFCRYLEEDYKIRDNELICCCPFHDECRPSFTANIETGLYHCFSCGAKGNATTFIAEMEGISTKEAWKKLQKLSRR